MTFSSGTGDRLGRNRNKGITLRAHGGLPNHPTRRGSVVAVTDADEHDTAEQDEIDLDAIEADLDAVQAALDRLADGSYWTDEVSGEPIPVDVLDADPLVRRV